MPASKRKTSTNKKESVKETKKTDEVKTSPKEELRQTDTSSYNRQNTMQSSNLLITLLVAVLAFSTGYLFSQVRGGGLGKTSTTTTQATQQAQPTEQQVNVSMDQVRKLFDGQHITFGDKNSKLVFTEFNDESCPFCQIANGHNPDLAKQANFTYKADGGTYIPPGPEIENLVNQGKAAFAIVYTTGHGNGKLAQQALYCAYDKGPDTFWGVHHKLMTNDGYNLLNNDVQNDTGKTQKLVDFLADQIDSSYLSDCITSGKYASRVDRDEKTGQEFGVSGTPHFLVNTKAYRGAYSWTDMQGDVNSALGQ